MKDQAFFDNPQEFNPENFSAENKKERNPYAFMAFGHGPRNCIGMRFALLQLKTVTSKIVHQYNVVPCAKTPKGILEPDPLSSSGTPKGGVWVKVEKRKLKA